jgi:hypothetical protein
MSEWNKNSWRLRNNCVRHWNLFSVKIIGFASALNEAPGETRRIGFERMCNRPCGMQFKIYTTLYCVLMPVVYCFGFVEKCTASLTALDTAQMLNERKRAACTGDTERILYLNFRLVNTLFCCRNWGYLSLSLLLPPLRSVGHPWNALFHFSFLILRLVGLLG